MCTRTNGQLTGASPGCRVGRGCPEEGCRRDCRDDVSERPPGKACCGNGPGRPPAEGRRGKLPGKPVRGRGRHLPAAGEAVLGKGCGVRRDSPGKGGSRRRPPAGSCLLQVAREAGSRKAACRRLPQKTARTRRFPRKGSAALPESVAGELLKTEERS